MVKVTTGHPSYRRLLGEEATSTIDSIKDVETVRQCVAARLSTKCPTRFVTKSRPMRSSRIRAIGHDTTYDQRREVEICQTVVPQSTD